MKGLYAKANKIYGTIISEPCPVIKSKTNNGRDYMTYGTTCVCVKDREGSLHFDIPIYQILLIDSFPSKTDQKKEVLIQELIETCEFRISGRRLIINLPDHVLNNKEYKGVVLQKDALTGEFSDTLARRAIRDYVEGL